MTVKNKWNGRIYTVLGHDSVEVELQRDDGTTFRIARKEFYANYTEKFENNEK